MIGMGVLKGMALTFREFVGTYPAGKWVLEWLGVKTTHGLVTVQYPETRQQHPERFRYFPFLVYDNTPDNLRCVACKICEQECPPQCIFIERSEDAQARPLKNQYGRPQPKTFDIDTSICMSCRICVDVCPFDAIEMDNKFEFASAERNEPMLFDKEHLLKSADYFQEIRPVEGNIVNQRVAAKAKKTPPATPPAAAAPATPPSTISPTTT